MSADHHDTVITRNHTEETPVISLVIVLDQGMTVPHAGKLAREASLKCTAGSGCSLFQADQRGVGGIHFGSSCGEVDGRGWRCDGRGRKERSGVEIRTGAAGAPAAARHAHGLAGEGADCVAA